MTTLTHTPTTGLFSTLSGWVPGVDTVPVMAAALVLVLCLSQLF